MKKVTKYILIGGLIGFIVGLIVLVSILHLIIDINLLNDPYFMPGGTIEPNPCENYLQCGYNEVCKNGECIVLKCEKDKVVMEHSCRDKYFIINKDVEYLVNSHIAFNGTFEMRKSDNVKIEFDFNRVAYADVKINNQEISDHKFIDKSLINKGINTIDVLITTRGMYVPFHEHYLTIGKDSYLASPSLKSINFKDIAENNELNPDFLYHKSCEDSDGGINYEVVGWCEYDNGGGVRDSCRHDVLTEFYCTDRNFCDNKEINCEEYCKNEKNGSDGYCEDGKCVCGSSLIRDIKFLFYKIRNYID